MIIPDINLLVYAYDAASPSHDTAVAWWQRCLNGDEPVGLPMVVAFGFVRITTHSRVFTEPMSAEEAVGHVRSWLRRPIVTLLPSPEQQAERVFELLLQAGTAGNLVTDAQIAATALELGAVVHTADSDFLRFPGLRWLNPLTGKGNTRRR